MVWLTQQQIAGLFGTRRPAITKHLQNIYKTGELSENSTCSILEHMGAGGVQKYKTRYYNLDAVCKDSLLTALSLFIFHFSLIDTDDLSNETYEGIIVEAERFHHNLTLHFGVLADDCDIEEDYLAAAEKLVKKIMKAKPNDLEDFLFGEVYDFSALPATLEKMLANIARVREIPEEKRTYEF